MYEIQHSITVKKFLVAANIGQFEHDHSPRFCTSGTRSP